MTEQLQKNEATISRWCFNTAQPSLEMLMKITWIRSTFPQYRCEMKGLDWGEIFDEFGEGVYDTVALEKQIHDLMEDDEIMNKSGIYRYVFMLYVICIIYIRLDFIKRRPDIHIYNEEDISETFKCECGFDITAIKGIIIAAICLITGIIIWNFLHNNFL